MRDKNTAAIEVGHALQALPETVAAEGIREVGEARSKYSQFDILLPSQYSGALRKFTPEQRLMVAVLHDVLDCVEKYRFAIDPQDCQLFEEARQWLHAKEADWFYSFQSICSALDLDSGAVLRHLRVEPVDATLHMRKVS